MKNEYKVIIDARIINDELSGIGRYTYEIIRCGVELGIKYILLVNERRVCKNIFGDNANIEYIKIKSKFMNPMELLEIPYKINKFDKKKTIFHSPSFISSPLIKLNSIMTIHDLNHLKLPQYYSKFHKYYYEIIVKRSALKCKKILTVSNFSKSELLSWLKCDEKRISVTYNGVDQSFYRVSDEEKIRVIKLKYNLPEKFMLYIGNYKEHKNIEIILQAMSESTRDNLVLVISGNGNDRLNNIINRLNLEQRVKFIGFIDDNDLPIIYSLANIFVYPSLYEGFGLPVLESMACGCRTIVSDIPVFKELTEGKCEYFNANDSYELANLLEKDLEVNIEELKKQVSKFTWNNTAMDTKKIYDMVVKGE